MVLKQTTKNRIMKKKTYSGVEYEMIKVGVGEYEFISDKVNFTCFAV